MNHSKLKIGQYFYIKENPNRKFLLIAKHTTESHQVKYDIKIVASDAGYDKLGSVYSQTILTDLDLIVCDFERPGHHLTKIFK